MTFFLDVSPVGGGAAVAAAVVVLLVFLGGAFIAFKLLKRTMKMAFRIAIVAIILAIGVAGSVFFYAVGTSKPARPARPTQSSR